MKQITVTLSVDEDVIMRETDGTSAATLDEAISQELNWLNDSGIYVDNWAYSDEKKPDKPIPRIDALSNFRDNEILLSRAAEEQKQSKIDSLITQIKALEPRIRELIATGNACLESNIPLTGQAFGCREDYGTHQFFTNSWSHLVGFVGNPGNKSCKIKLLGIDAGGACGKYSFRTDGVRVFYEPAIDLHAQNAPSIRDMQKFLSKFNEFEASFYAYVDKTIEKQKKSVDKLIDSAQEKALHQNASSTRGLREAER